MSTLASNREYYYGQTSAPPMAGVVGYFIAILDAFLVNGFNPRNVTSLTVSNNIATVTTSTAHGYEVGTVIANSGANESVFNSDFEILDTPTTTSFTFAVTTALTAATGTMTCKVAPLGWEKTFSGTNKAVYRSVDVTTNQLYLRVDDTNAQYATAIMYETMTNVDTGTGASATKYWKKSSTSDTTSRPWYAIGNGKVFYFHAEWYSTYTLQAATYVFGWFPSLKPGDGYNTMLIGHDISTAGNASSNIDFTKIGSISEYEGQIIARSYSQLGGYISFYKLGGIAAHSDMGYLSTFQFPTPTDNGIHLFPVYIYEYSTNVFRGKMPGLYVPNEHTNGAIISRDKTFIINDKRYICYRLAVGNNIVGNCWFTLDEEWT